MKHDFRQDWFQIHSFELLIIITIGIFIFIYINGRIKDSSYKGFSSFNLSTQQRKKRVNKTEEKCRRILESLFDKPFPTVRPNFLKNPATGKNLELDMYNDELRLAVEYNGSQHYGFNTRFHRNINDLEYQEVKDRWKLNRCRENGINLVIIPYTVKEKELEAYIISRLEKLGFRLE